MMEKLRPQAQGVQINAMQFLDSPTPAQLTKTGASLHHFLGLPRWPMLASNRDPTLQEYGIGKPSNNSGCYALIHSGGQLVSPAKYMEVIKAAQPEIFVTIADEVLGDASKKRVVASVDRTTRWLDECLESLGLVPPSLQEHEAKAGHGHGAPAAAASGGSPEQQPAAKKQRLEDGTAAGARTTDEPAAAAAAAEGWPAGVPLVLAPVMGSSFPEERARSAAAAAARPVAGFALCGFGMGEDAALRPRLLAAAVERLPADKPRLLVGMGGPEEVLEGVMAGADIFDCGYPTHATANGYALAFPLRPPSSDIEAASAAAAAAAAVEEGGPDEGADDSKINLWAQQYRLDKRPLVEGCACFACRSHTRAYLHHLLNSHEMLGSVLLEVHNTHHWLGFFEAVREAVVARRLGRYAEWFAARRRAARAVDLEAPAPAAATRQED